jgi:Protein of unknown function (DUF3465)
MNRSGDAFGRLLGPALLCLLQLSCTRVSDGNNPNAAVYNAWRDQRSRIEVTATGNVARLLGTREGPAGTHEGFLLHLRGAGGHGLTVRVEDNITITGPVPLQAGDDVEVRGEYVYGSRGGVIHYTHHDPRGRHIPGYIRVHGRLYT